jgi:regulatory protein
MSDESREKALKTAANVLEYKHRSRAALLSRLIEKGLDPDDAAYAVARLQELGFLDDGAYARALVEDYKNRGYGAAHIRQALRQKAFEPLDIDDALADFTPDTEKMQKYIAAKIGPSPDRKALKRVGDGLFRRGHGWGDIQAALRAYTDALEDEPIA